MSDIIFLEKVPLSAVPIDDDAKRIFDGFKIGQKFEVVPWRDRNYGYHKKLFSLLSLVINHNKNWKSAHFLLKLIQTDIGSVDVGIDMYGKVTQFPKSIAFKTMKEIEFTGLFSKIIQHMLDHLSILVPGMSREQFNDFVQRILNYD